MTMRRTLQFVLLLAFIIPFGVFVRGWVPTWTEQAKDISFGIIIGMAICYAVWMWDDRQRAKAGNRTFGD